MSEYSDYDNIRPIDLEHETWDSARSIKPEEYVDPLWGVDLIELSDENIQALQRGEYAYCHNGEYAQLIRMKRKRQ